MTNVVFFVEGNADAKFLQDFVQVHFGQSMDKGTDIIVLGDTHQILPRSKDFEQQTLSGKTMCVIFDADDEKSKTSFRQTKQRIERELDEIRRAMIAKHQQFVEHQRFEFKTDIFLFPNNSDDGNLETLLEQLLNSINKPLLDCWTQFVTCLAQHQNESQRTIYLPNSKDKIYSYLSLLHNDSKKAHESTRDYANKDDWNLDHSAAQPLKTFLSPYFPEPAEK